MNKDGDECLCLAPQFKTQHMNDPTCECEAGGLTTGKGIFMINHRLVTLLCADALNNDIYWQDLQKENLTNGLLLLHPQLNRNPKHTIFCRIRQEMQAHNHPGICITCNWAENTHIIRFKDQSTYKEITVSWSCFYHKHQDLSLLDWKEKGIDQRQNNSKKGLFGAFMMKQHMEVWFSSSGEQAILVIIPNTISNQYGVTQIRGITAEEQFIWVNDENCWQKREFHYNLRKIIEEPKSIKELGDVSRICNFLSKCYNFPFEQQDKYLVDCFFALTLHGIDSFMTINEQEELSDWTLLIDRSEFDFAEESLCNLLRLTNILQQKSKIPARLKKLEEPHCFCYESSTREPYHTNIKTSDQRFLLVFAKSDREAHKIKRELLAKEFSNNSDLAEKILGVVYTDLFNQEPHFLPEYSTEISQGNNSVMEGDITNGGN